MDDSLPSLGTPSRLFAEEMVLRAIVDILATTLPGAKQLVFDLAHRRLSLTGPKVPQEHEFFARAHSAIDEIMQSTKDHVQTVKVVPRETGATPMVLPSMDRTRRAREPSAIAS